MPEEISAADTHTSVKEQVVEFYEDFKQEVKREAHNPLASSQGDLLVRKHLNGLVISFFVLIAVSLTVMIVGYAIYTHY